MSGDETRQDETRRGCACTRICTSRVL